MTHLLQKEIQDELDGTKLIPETPNGYSEEALNNYLKFINKFHSRKRIYLKPRWLWVCKIKAS